MSTILNQKEEVLSIELTKHGRKLLGFGLFRPEYYSFFDDSIIYDSNYAGIGDEDTNDIQNRILNKSLTFKSFNVLGDSLLYPLGKSDSINDNAPAWEITALNGKIVYNHSNSSYYKKIFDVSQILYNLSLNKSDPQNGMPILEQDYLLFDLKELNVDDDIDNFEIELVTYDELNGGKEAGLERKLYFTNIKNNIIDDIIYDETELPSNFFDVKINEQDVAYYFDLLVDDEIDTDFIVGKEKSIQERIKGTYTSNAVPQSAECDPKELPEPEC